MENSTWPISCSKSSRISWIRTTKKRWRSKKLFNWTKKKRLIKENEELLQKFNQSGYQRSISSLASQKIPTPKNLSLFTKTKHDVIYNNIFGNSNPNPSTAYPKWGHVHPKIIEKII